MRLRLRGEGGYTLPELLSVMVILGVVTGSLTTMLVQGSNAQIDMNNRFQAQQEARLALDRLRREVHCASDLSPRPAGSVASVTLVLPSQCASAGGNANITWCTLGVAPNRWALWRYPGTACSGSGTRVADYLTAANVFTFSAASGELSKLSVSFPVDIKPGAGAKAYTLQDEIVLRNSNRN